MMKVTVVNDDDIDMDADKDNSCGKHYYQIMMINIIMIIRFCTMKMMIKSLRKA